MDDNGWDLLIISTTPPAIANNTLTEMTKMPISSTFLFKTLAAAVYGSIAMMALIGNLLFCYVIWRSQKLHTVTHMLMTNLGICNLLFLLFHPAFFMTTYIFQTSWNLGSAVCKVSFSTAYVTATASFYFMSLVAIDRWLAVFKRKFRLDKRKCIVLTLFVWIGSITVSSPYLYFTNKINLHTMDSFASQIFEEMGMPKPKPHYHCGIDCDASCKHVLQLISIVAQYCVPLLIMIPTYAHLAVFLWRRPEVGVQTKEKHQRSQERKRKTLLILLAIVGSLIICWSPMFSVGLLHSYGLIDNNSMALFILTSIIALVAVLLTPLLYLMNDSFRIELMRLTRCLKPAPGANGHPSLARHHRDPSTWADNDPTADKTASQKTTKSFQSMDKSKQTTPLIKKQDKRHKMNQSMEESTDWGCGDDHEHKHEVVELDVHCTAEDTKTTAVRSSGCNSFDSTNL